MVRKFIVPRQRRETTRPSRPTWVYSTSRVYAAATEASASTSEPSRSGVARPPDEHERDGDRAAQDPAQISVASCPIASAVRRPVRAGAPPPYSRDPPAQGEDAPEHRARTSRWTRVTHTTTRYVIDPSVTNATAIACQTVVTSPNPRGAQHPQRPREVHRGERLAGERPALPEEPRGDDRAHAAGAEHEPERGRLSAEVVLHHDRHEGLPRSPDREQAHGRPDHRDHEPARPADVPEPFGDLPEERRRSLVVGLGLVPRAHQQDHQRRERERGRVREEGDAGAEPGDERAPDQRPHQRHRERSNEVSERVGLNEQVVRHDRRGDRRERGLEDGLPGTVDEHEPEHERDRRLVVQRQDPERRDRDEADHVAGDHQDAAVEAVGKGTAREHEDDLRERPRDPGRGRARPGGSRSGAPARRSRRGRSRRRSSTPSSRSTGTRSRGPAAAEGCRCDRGEVGPGTCAPG